MSLNARLNNVKQVFLYYATFESCYYINIQKKTDYVAFSQLLLTMKTPFPQSTFNCCWKLLMMTVVRATIPFINTEFLMEINLHFIHLERNQDNQNKRKIIYLSRFLRKFL